MPSARVLLMLLLVLLAALPPCALGQSFSAEDSFKALHSSLFPALPDGQVPPYRTETHMVAMRDGVKLNTVAFIPLDLKKKHYDTVMIRTPYGTDGLKSEGETYISQGFAALMQDFRGRYRSQGIFECWFNASTDAADTLAWLVEQPWSSKIAFQQGTSAPGIATYFSEVGMPSPLVLRALFPVVATAELHKTAFQGGAYRYNLLHGWLNGIGEPGFERNFTTHEGETAYWENVTLGDKWARVTAPGVHLTGWYDIFNQQQLDAYAAFQTQSTLGRGFNILVVMPTGHCPGGQVPWPGALDGFAFATELSIALFKALGSDVAAAEPARALLANTSLVYWYVMGPGLPGTQGNFWTNAPAFPTPNYIPLYLNAGGALGVAPPAAFSAVSYIYDPADPYPTLGGNTLGYSTCGPWDQAALERRRDIVLFTTSPLTSAVTVTGHMTAVLYVSSNCTDTDFAVRVTDVFPNGTSLLLQNGIVRMRWRNGGAEPSLISPGTVYEVTIDVWSTSYIFNPGHAIRLGISSSNYPLFSANPNTGRPLADTTAAPIPANNTVFFGGAYPSRVVLPVVSREQLQPISLKRK